MYFKDEEAEESGAVSWWLPRGCKGEGKGKGFINDLGFILLEISRGQGNLSHFYLLSRIISAAGVFV